MRIAVTFYNEEIFQHFGQTERFAVYEVQNKKVLTKTIVNTNGSGHGALADILKKIGAEILICGGIGGGAKAALAEAGIKLYPGVTGTSDSAVEAFLSGNLDFNPDTQCEHHGHEHHGDHECDGHSCHEK